MTRPDPLDTVPTKHDTRRAIRLGQIDRDDECSQCGDPLRDVGHFWSTDHGNYDTIRCAEQHAEDLDRLTDKEN